MSKIIENGLFFGAKLECYDTLESFVTANKECAMIKDSEYSNSYKLAIKQKVIDSLDNIDSIIYVIENSSTGRNVYIEVMGEVYKFDVFSQESLIKKARVALSMLKDEITLSFKENNEKVFKLLDVHVEEKDKQKYKVYKDTLYDDPEKKYFRRLEINREGTLKFVNACIPLGILDDEVDLEPIVKSIVQSKDRAFYNNIYQVLHEEIDEEGLLFDNFIDKLIRTYVLWDGEYTEDMLILKEKCEKDLVEKLIENNKNRYSTILEIHFEKKCTVYFTDNVGNNKQTTGVLTDINYKDKYIIVSKKNSNVEIYFNAIKSIKDEKGQL